MPEVSQLSPLLGRLSLGKIEWQMMSGGYDYWVLIQTTGKGEEEARLKQMRTSQLDTMLLGKNCVSVLLMPIVTVASNLTFPPSNIGLCLFFSLFLASL